MITTSRGAGDVMEESTVPRKSDAVLSALIIDSAVVSSARRDLFCDKLKCRCKAQSFATNSSLLKFVLFSF